MNGVPTFFITGTFGAGKTTQAALLAERLPQCFVLDCDWLMESLGELSGRDLYEDSQTWPALGNVWLTLAATNARAARPSVLLSPAEPAEISALSMRALLEDVNWLLLDCPDEELRRRLAARNEAHLIDASLAYAKVLRNMALESIRTDEDTPAVTADRIATWVKSKLA